MTALTHPTQSVQLVPAAPSAFNDEQISLIKQTVAQGTSDLELSLFLEVAKSSGLNPFQRQIYAVMRYDARTKGQKMVIQTGIDGYRLIAARSGLHMGTTDAEYGPVNAEGFPEFARVIVKKLVHGHVAEFPATARWSEYVQTKDEYKNNTKTGNKVASDMWARMPHTMLSKCAEALALRKAFPAELSGVYSDVEMAQADNTAPVAVQEVKTEAAPVSQQGPSKALAAWVEKTHKMRARVVNKFPKADDIIEEMFEQVVGWDEQVNTARGMYESVRDYGLELDEEIQKTKPAPVSEPDSEPVVETMITPAQIKQLQTIANGAGAMTSADRAALWGYMQNLAPQATKSLTEGQADNLLEAFKPLTPAERIACVEESRRYARGQLVAQQ